MSRRGWLGLAALGLGVPAAVYAIRRWRSRAGQGANGTTSSAVRPSSSASSATPTLALMDRMLDAPGKVGRATVQSARADVFPLPLLFGERQARITSGYKTRNPSRPDHDGVDLFYPRKPGDPDWPVGDGEGTTNRRWIVPRGTPALATAAGVVQLAGPSPTGFRVWVDHGGVRTGYFHLARLLVAKGQRVRAGEPLGLVGDSPRGHDARHLHFELSLTDAYRPADPTAYLAAGRHLAAPATASQA